MQRQRKVVDRKIVELIQRCADNRERALFVITGKLSVERIADIYSLWVNKTMLPKASILWCYEENIALSGYRQKQLTKLKHNRKIGIQKEITDEDTPQNLMLRHATIKFMYYKDTARALGQTYDILVLQEAAKVTPNILCHTIETVQGGGFIILVDSNGSLRKGDMFIARMLSYIRGCENALIVNDVLDVVSSCRFSENMSSDKKVEEDTDETNHSNVEKDDEINHIDSEHISEKDANGEIIQDNLTSTTVRNTLCPSGIIKLCLSNDQANALEKIYENLFMLRNGSTDTVPNIISVVASRGRGKSALLGLLIASICVHKRQEMKPNTTETLLQNVPSDLEKILVIAPMANNNSGPFITIHPHCIKALETMGMVKGINYSVNVSQVSNRGKKRTISGLSGTPITNQILSGSSVFNSNIFALKLKTIYAGSSHVVSYIDTETIVKIHNMGESLLSSVLSSFDLVIVDEAASMPIPVVRTISGISKKGSSGTDELNWGLQRHVILSSTVHGYEGTGRSLAIKLFAELEKMYSTSKGNTINYTNIKLETPIRYNRNCNVEKFLNKFLLLNSDEGDTKETALPPIANTNFFVLSPCIFLPYFKGVLPSDNDNPLEIILNSAYSLFTTSHYRNSPEDIRRMMVGDGGSQLTRHGIGVLIEKKDKTNNDKNNSVNILSAVHFAFEGGSSYGTSGSSSSDGSIRSGDVSVQGHLAPGVLENYYQEKRQSSDNSSFSNILGLRVVRIATRPNAQRMGYGKTLMRGLEDFFSVSEKCLKLDAKTQYSSITDIVQNVIDWALEIKEPSNLKSKTPVLPPLLISKKDFQNNPRIIPAVSRCIDSDNKSFIPKYISVSYGLSTNLLRFYALLGFSAVFIKTTQNNTTGEHSCIVVKEICSTDNIKKESIEQEKESKKNGIISEQISMESRLKALFTSWANDFSWRLIRESRGMLRHMDPELVLRMLKANDEYCRKNYDHYVNNLTREREYFKDTSIIGPHRTPLLSARDMLRISAVAGISSGRCSISYNSLNTSEEEGYHYGGNNGDDCYTGVSGWRLMSDLFPILIDYYFSESPTCFSTTTKPNKKQGLLASSGNSYTNTRTDEISVLSLTPATLIVLLGAQMKGNLEWTAASSLNMPPSQSSQLLQRGIETIYNYITSEQLKEAECKHENKKSPKL